jgi:hypothetical protein
MKHEIKSRYPATAEVVMRMFANPDFHLAKLEGLGLKKYQVLEKEAQGDDFRIRIERKVPLEAPALVRKVVPAETTAVSDERWNLRTRKGRVSISPGIPVDMNCDATITDVSPGECIVNYVWDVRAKVPLIGGALEKFICSDLESKMVDETRVTASLIARFGQSQAGH